MMSIGNYFNYNQLHSICS